MNRAQAEQKLIDVAHAHISKTRQPSLADTRCEIKSCTYGGIGCAFALAIKPEFRNNPNYSVTSVIDIYRRYNYVLEPWAENISTGLAMSVQDAHDDNHRLRGDEFVEMFNRQLKQVCEEFGYAYPEVKS